MKSFLKEYFNAMYTGVGAVLLTFAIIVGFLLFIAICISPAILLHKSHPVYGIISAFTLTIILAPLAYTTLSRYLEKRNEKYYNNL